MSTLFSFPSKNQIDAQGAVTENPGMTQNHQTMRAHGSFFKKKKDCFVLHSVPTLSFVVYAFQ